MTDQPKKPTTRFEDLNPTDQALVREQLSLPKKPTTRFEDLNPTDQALVREQLSLLGGRDPETGSYSQHVDKYYSPKMQEVWAGRGDFTDLANEFLSNTPEFLRDAHKNEEVRRENATRDCREYRDPIDRLSGPRIDIERPSVPGGARVIQIE